jgi:hypothetical protein
MNVGKPQSLPPFLNLSLLSAGGLVSFVIKWQLRGLTATTYEIRQGVLALGNSELVAKLPARAKLTAEWGGDGQPLLARYELSKQTSRPE